jgi:hypothetical protein
MQRDRSARVSARHAAALAIGLHGFTWMKLPERWGDTHSNFLTAVKETGEI